MKNRTKNSFFSKKEELRIFLNVDERFSKLKPRRKECVLNVLTEKKEVFNLKKPELDIVMSIRGY